MLKGKLNKALIIILLVINFTTVPYYTRAKSSLLLDRHPNAKAAYGLRKLRADYAGSALRIRRACDNAEIDVGFNEQEFLDTQVIEDFMAVCADTSMIPLPLNIDNTAAAAYGLRKLSSNYLGDALEVRRADNNNTLDIGFNQNGELDTVALEAFCNSPATNCYVSVWYDQSNNLNHAYTTSLDHQAKIYDSIDGIIEDANGRIAILTDGIDDIYRTDLAFGDEHSIFISATKLEQTVENVTGYRPVIGNVSNTEINALTYGPRARGDERIRLILNEKNNETKIAFDDAWLLDEKLLFTAIAEGLNKYLKFYKNNSFMGQATIKHIGNFKDIVLFGQTTRAERRFKGYTNEFIIYNNDQTSNAELLGASVAYDLNLINKGYVTIWYDQSGNDFHANQAQRNQQALIYENGLIFDSEGMQAVKSDGIDDKYVTTMDLNQVHSVFASVTRLPQTSGGSAFRPFIGNDDFGDFDNYLGYGTRSGDDRRMAASMNGPRRQFVGSSWNNNEKMIFEALTNANQMITLKNLNYLNTQTADINNATYENIQLLGANASRNFAGYTNEILVYDFVETDDNFRVDLRLDVAGAYGLSSLANFSGNLSLSNTVIDANAAIGTVVGELATVNNDNPGFNHSYQLITDPDDMFEVVGNQLITKKEFNYNQKSSYLVTIRATEENGNKFIDQEFEVNLNNPIFNGRIFLSFKNTYKFLPVGSVVTDIKVNNISNSNAKYNFYLSGTDSKYFKIDGRKLLIAKNLPINKKYLNINIKAEEQNSSFYREQNFSIRILNSLRRDNGDNADSDQAEEDKENEVSKLPQELDHDQNNIIDFSELSKIVINLNQALKLNRKLRKRSFRSVINKVDLNEDSVFDDQDIKEIHKYIDQLPDFNYIRNVLNLIKTNKKGNITFKSSESTIDKFNRAMRNKFKNKDRQAELIKVFDYNSDGKLDQTDLNSLKTVLELGLSRDNIENKSKRINRINRVLKL